MSELKTNLQEILQEKQEKIIPENIKKDVQIFDVVGTLEGGTTTSGVKLFETEEEMQADSAAQEGDLAIVYNQTNQTFLGLFKYVLNHTDTSKTQIVPLINFTHITAGGFTSGDYDTVNVKNIENAIKSIPSLYENNAVSLLVFKYQNKFYAGTMNGRTLRESGGTKSTITNKCPDLFKNTTDSTCETIGYSDYYSYGINANFEYYELDLENGTLNNTKLTSAMKTFNDSSSRRYYVPSLSDINTIYLLGAYRVTSSRFGFSCISIYVWLF